MKDQDKTKKELIDEPVELRESTRPRGNNVKTESEILGDHYGLIVESVPSGIVMTDRAGKITFVNSMVNKMFGYREEELIGKPVEILVPREYRKSHREFRNSYLSKPGARAMGEGRDLFAVRKDGTKFPVEIGLNPVKTDKGLVVLSTIVDISVRREAEIKLREERERTQKYLDVAEVIFLVLDDKGEVALINRKGCEILESSEENILGKNWFDNFIPPDIRDELLGVYKKLMRGRGMSVSFYENCIITKSGNVKEVLWHNTALVDESGRITGTLSSGVDITDRKQAERMLHEREERLRGIMDNTTDAILVFDNCGAIETVNKAALELFSVDEGNKIEDIRELITPEHQDTFTEKLKKARDGFIITDYETEMIKKDGRRVSVSIGLVYMKQGEGRFIETIRDITSRLAMRKKVIELEKSQIIGKMAEGFAHHIGTPLASMLLRVQMLKEDMSALPERDMVNEKLNLIEKQILYGQRVIQRLLKFVSQPGSERSPEKVSSIVEESIDIIRPILKKRGIRVVNDLDQNLVVNVDVNLMHLVCTDIIMNAVDAMQESGTLSVVASSDNDHGFANIKIIDTGGGISKETIPFVFEPFFTTKPAGMGTGLGLTVAKRIINDHGGGISINSREGEGTTVSIKLPLSAEGLES